MSTFAQSLALPAALLMLLGGCEILNPVVQSRTGLDPGVSIARLCAAAGTAIGRIDAAYVQGRLDPDPDRNRGKAVQALTAASHARAICDDPEHGDQGALVELTAALLDINLLTGG